MIIELISNSTVVDIDLNKFIDVFRCIEEVFQLSVDNPAKGLLLFQYNFKP